MLRPHVHWMLNRLLPLLDDVAACLSRRSRLPSSPDLLCESSIGAPITTGTHLAAAGLADEVCTSETGIFGFLHTSYFKPTYLSFWDSMHDGPQTQPEMFFLDIDRFPDGQAKLLEDGSPVMVRAALSL